MSKLYISEYAVPNPAFIGITPGSGYTQVVSFTTATQSAAFQSTTGMIRIHSDAACSWLIGTDPTATVSHPRLAAGVTEFVMVAPGTKISVIAASA